MIAGIFLLFYKLLVPLNLRFGRWLSIDHSGCNIQYQRVKIRLLRDQISFK